MRVAFHFNVSAPAYKGKNYAIAIERKLFNTLFGYKSGENIHIKVYIGDLLVYSHKNKIKSDIEFRNRLVGANFPIWKTIEDTLFLANVCTHNIFVIYIEGLNIRTSEYLDNALKEDSTYLGAMEITSQNTMHWVLYQQSLIPIFRLVNRELRVFYDGTEDSKDIGLFEEFEKLPFQNITWENTGVRHTILDDFDTIRHYQRIEEIYNLVPEEVLPIAEEVLLRLKDLSPQSCDTLFSAFKALAFAETEEDIAQASLSCRRYLEGVADAIYPPREELVDGRRVDKPAYRNRIWAYLQDQLNPDRKKYIPNRVQIIGQEIDKLDKCANKGLHAVISKDEAYKLIVDLIAITYEILVLAPPPYDIPTQPHAKAIEKFFEKVFEKYKT